MPGFPRLQASYEIAVVGGGHAGLQAALKSALLMHSAVVVDRGPKYARSYYAPVMDNIPGFPEGVSGHALLDRQAQAVRRQDAWVAYCSPASVTQVVPEQGGYRLTFEWLKQVHVVKARAVVLAMGVVDRMLELQHEIKPIFPWANQALVDFCILCDGHTLTGKSVGVLGHDAFAARTALDVLHFRPSSVEMLTHGRRLLEGTPEPDAAALRTALEDHRIPVVEAEVTGFDELREHRFGVRFADGSHRSYEKGFSALGWWDLHQEIPRSLGCRFDADGYVVTDDDGRAVSDRTGEPIQGLYCAGDQRNGWNQIPEAWATAERAVIHAYAEYL